ncbi:unnamed protein product [Parascedosporium putredinis]|uniref:Beta-lactamase-related domain-containing protein n=1 Tax=Parascedosporium putredinis TaxID=1442378 RepID=A0A9P1H8S9_9PEZI|nr:unnamed protein product [Parascedosporium putredinis]CAI8000130.1 unnamed protein product [Parascedosporium putredinis]
MRAPFRLAALLAGLGLSPHAASASPNCAFRGPAYPLPTDLSAHPLILEAAEQLTAGFNDLAANDTNLIATNNSWSIQAWSTHERADPSALLWSHYHSAMNLDAVNSTGVRDVGPDTVYRLGSLTKVFTVLTWLAEAGDEYWYKPITDFIPELKTMQERNAGEEDPVRYTDWDEITIGALASQMAGIPKDCELTQDYGPGLVNVGFPPPEKLPETPVCGVYVLCNRTQFFDGLQDLMPVFAPDYAPAYSNVAYMLLAYALEELTGKDWETLLATNVLDPLGLENTFFNTPNDTSIGVIPGNASMHRQHVRLRRRRDPRRPRHPHLRAPPRRRHAPLAPPRNLHLGPHGRAEHALGHPPHQHGPPLPLDVRLPKAGRIGDYSALIIMLPDYGIGFTVLTAGNMPGNMNFDFADAIGATLLPAVHAAARDLARANFAGSYEFANVTALNSSLVVAVDDDPGLSVAGWVSNYTNMAAVAVMLQLSTTDPVNPRIRFYPTGLETVVRRRQEVDGTEVLRRRVAFKATFEHADSPARENRLFSTDCATWLSASSNLWAARALDELVFEIDEDGTAVAVEPVALRVVLERVDALTPPPPPPVVEEPPVEEGEPEAPTGTETGKLRLRKLKMAEEEPPVEEESPAEEEPPVEEEAPEEEGTVEPPAEEEPPAEDPQVPDDAAVLAHGIQVRKSHNFE